MSIVAAYMVPHPPLIIPEVGGGKEKSILNIIGILKECKEIVTDKPDHLLWFHRKMCPFRLYSYFTGKRQQVLFQQLGAPRMKLRLNMIRRW
jgi:hypothetical protein